MKKKVIALILAVLLVLSCAPFGMAYTTEAMQAANHLNQLGMFAGSGSNPDGTPNYKLDDKPKRTEGIVMLLALLGEREKADGSHTSPFTDVPTWAKKYVNYAYRQKYTSGVSSTKFGSSKEVSSNEYLTFVLTAMGYSSKTDFNWKDPYTLADKLGITDGQYYFGCKFTRGDMCIMSNNALNAKVNGSDKTLLEVLADKGVIKNVFIESQVVSQLETEQFSYVALGTFRYNFLKVTNNSKYDLRLNVTATFYDENGKMVAVKDTSQEAVESGEDTLLIFLPDTAYARAEYKISAKEEPTYECVRSDITYSGSIVDDKVILTLTNTGTKPAEFVEAYVLFFKDGELVYHDSAYFTDDEYELKPSALMNKELRTYDTEFDSYEVFITGRRYKTK